jgi:hypothetical protein
MSLGSVMHLHSFYSVFRAVGARGRGLGLQEAGLWTGTRLKTSDLRGDLHHERRIEEYIPMRPIPSSPTDDFA